MKTRLFRILTALLLTLLLLIQFIPSSLADGNQDGSPASTPAATDGSQDGSTASPPVVTDGGSEYTSLDLTVTAMGTPDSDPTHFTYNNLTTNTCEVTGYTGSSAQIGIPATADNAHNQRTIVGIAGNAFKGRTSLTSVASMPANVTYINNDVFNGCTSLTSVTLSTGLQTIGSNAFDTCTKLTSITLPSNLKNIYSGAFENSGLTSISIPDSVTALSPSVFYNCTSLQTAKLPAGLTTVRDSLFMLDAALTSLTLPTSGCTSIEGNAFDETGITSVSIPSSVQSIGDSAFYGCPNLSSVTFQNGLKTIGKYVFENCPKLSSLTLPATTLTAIGDLAFSGTKLTSVFLPDSVTTLGTNIFENCKSLTTAKLPSGIGAIPANTFNGDSLLANVTFPTNYTSVGAHAFAGTAITSVSFPSGLTTIDDYAFNSCTQLASITFYNNLKTIGEAAFCGDAALNNVVLPASLTTLKDQGFGYCQSLSNISFASGINLTKIEFNEFYLDPIIGIALPDSITSIEHDAFQGCVKLQSITIPANVTSIGDNAFKGCYYTSTNTGLKRVIILNKSTTTFGANVFTGDTLLGDTGGGICGFASSNVGDYVDQHDENGSNFLSLRTVTFHFNNGSANSSQYVADGDPIVKPSDPTKSGSVFYGWCSDSGLTTLWDFTTTISGADKDLYAKWVTPHTVSFDCNGGSQGGNPIPDQTVGYGMKASIPTPDPTKPGFTFGGWYTSGMAKKWIFDTDTVTSDITLYANWLVTHTVTFNSEKGSAVASQPVGDGLTATAPTDPTRSGYTFEGWYTDATFAVKWDFATVVTGDITLYAKWTAVSTYLSSITLTPGAPSASFTKSFSKTKTSYTVNLTEDTDSVTITPVPENSHATVTMTLNGTTTSPGTPISLPDKGDKATVKIKVAMNGKTSHTYTLTVVRAKSSYNQLYNINYDAGIGDKSFDPNVKDYTITLDQTIKNVTITPVLDTSNPDWNLEKIYIDGKLKTSKPYTLKNTGDTATCKIKVVAQNGASNTYTVKIQRAPSNDAYLSGLKTNLSGSPISPGFVYNNLGGYYVILPQGVGSVKLIATKDNGYASVTFIDGTKQYKSSSHSFSVANGFQKSVTIHVVAQDKTTNDYSVTIYRAPAISSFSATPVYKSYPSLSPGSYNNLTFNWTQQGTGDVHIDISSDGVSWQNIDTENGLAPGTHKYDFNGAVSGNYLAAGTYKARINITNTIGISTYKTLTFKILPIAAPTISASLNSIVYGGTQSTKITIVWSVFSKISVIVYDIPPHSVATIMSLSDYLAPGTKTLTWNGTDGSGTPLAAGDYIVRVTSGYYSQDVHVTITP